MSEILDWINQIQEDRAAAADPTDTSPRANAVRKACDWAASKGGFISGAPWIQGTCRPYWDDQPDYNPPSEPSPPFEGGQCAGVIYNGDIFLNIPGFGDTFQADFSGVGPISQTIEQSSTSSTTKILRVFNGNGVQIAARNSAGLENAPFIRNLVRADGLPDECGDPPESQPPPVNVPDAPMPGDPVDISPPGWTGPPITITFEPDGPIDPEDPTPTYGPINTPFGPGDVFGPPNGDIPEPITPPLPPSPGEDIAGGEPSGDLEDPDLSGVIGYMWTFTSIPSNRGGVAGKTPATYFEAIGTVQLKLRDADGMNYYGPQYVVREAQGAIARPDPSLDVVGVSWAFKPSFGTFQLRPLIADKE